MPRCVKFEVGDDCCYLTFGDGEVHHRRTRKLGDTVRGEMLLADIDEHGRIIGIEVIGGLQPCQQIEDDKLRSEIALDSAHAQGVKEGFELAKEDSHDVEK